MATIVSDELDYLQKLEKDLTHLQIRLREGYSGLPEVAAIKRELIDRLLVLEERAAQNPEK